MSLKKRNFELLVDIEDYFGLEAKDGSFVFRNDFVFPEVREGQLIAQTINEVPKQKTDKEIIAGKNVRLESHNDIYSYFAEKDGVVQLIENELSINKFFVFDDGFDPSFEKTEYFGNVFVKGDVQSGSVLNVHGNITVTGSVLDDSKLIADGFINVGKGINGGKTNIISQKTVKAQFVDGATINAGKNIVLGNYSSHAFLNSMGKIVVKKGSGLLEGYIFGGNSVSFKGIEAFVAGNVTASKTKLQAGINWAAVQKFDEIKDSIAQCNKLMTIILARINSAAEEQPNILDKTSPANLLISKEIENQIAQLGEATAKYKLLLKKRAPLKAEAECINRTATIDIKEIAFPDVTICIGSKELKLQEATPPACFKLINDQITIDLENTINVTN